ncbi:MAG: hypothetical protein ACXVWU_12360 [Nocardioides sp.]
MYARSTTLQAQPGSIDAGITYFEDEVLPALRGMDGFIGDSLVVDRESGRCIATVSWATEEARAAIAEPVRLLRERAAAVFGATAPAQVDEWEIAVMHRDHPTHAGACVRITWTSFDPADTDTVAEYWKQNVLPRAGALDGFCSASMLVDRVRGRSVGNVTFEDRAAMEASREAATAIRSTAATDVNVQIQDVGEFELAIAHLHVPEMV